MNNDLRQQALKIKAEIDNPHIYIPKHLGVQFYDKQYEIVDNLYKYKKVAVRSCNGAGKTLAVSAIILQFLASHYPAKVITTAPTWFSVENVLWDRIKTLYKNAPLPIGGKLLGTSLTMEDSWWAIGLSTNEQEKFAGYHEKNILFVFDEASGVKKEIYEATEGSMMGENSYWLQIGNPLDAQGKFYDAFRNPQWHGMKISAFDTPNVKQKREVIKGLVTWDWVEDRRREWGEDSPLYQARVLGDFPNGSIWNLFDLTVLEKAQTLKLKDGEVVMGVDVARSGSDTSTFRIYSGQNCIHKEKVYQWDTMSVAGKAIELIRRYNVKAVGVDVIGIGAGVVDRLYELKINVYGVNVASREDCDDKYQNLRAKIYIELSEDLKNGEINLLPNESGLIEELTNTKYSFHSNGRWIIEAKDGIKKLIGRSPDEADALAICNFIRRMYRSDRTTFADTFHVGKPTQMSELRSAGFVW